VLPALEWTLSVKYAANFRKNSYSEEISCKKDSLQENWFCCNQNQGMILSGFYAEQSFSI